MHRILYLSQMAPGKAHEVFGAICLRARARNRQLGVSGVLVFDGQRFCQFLQGPAAEVQALMATIARDPRHHGIVMLMDEPCSAENHPVNWAAGFVDPGDLDLLDPALGAPDTTPPLPTFSQLLARAELDSAPPPL